MLVLCDHEGIKQKEKFLQNTRNLQALLDGLKLFQNEFVIVASRVQKNIDLHKKPLARGNSLEDLQGAWSCA
jgi:hypothetical protein